MSDARAVAVFIVGFITATVWSAAMQWTVNDLFQEFEAVLWVGAISALAILAFAIAVEWYGRRGRGEWIDDLERRSRWRPWRR